jgi:hypothetical protein
MRIVFVECVDFSRNALEKVLQVGGVLLAFAPSEIRLLTLTTRI